MVGDFYIEGLIVILLLIKFCKCKLYFCTFYFLILQFRFKTFCLFFVAIGNAYSVLSDADKRKKYDLYGPDLQQQSVRESSDYTHGGFEGKA